MKTVIFYKSFFGGTKKYANLLRDEVGADLFGFDEIGETDLSQYGAVAAASGTYAGRMPLVKFLEKNWEKLRDKKLVALAVGGIPAEDPASVKSYEAIPEEIRKNIKYFKVPVGGGRAVSDEMKKANLAPVIGYLKSLE